LLRKLGQASLSGVSAVGNVLDLPGSMIRDAAAFQNPVDQLLSPFSDRNRTSGRDLLRKYGAAGKRDTWGNWGAGFGVEMALDPLTYVGLGGLSQAGKLAKGAGLLDDMARVAAKVKRVPMGSVGRNVARLTTTPRQLVLLGKQNAAARLTTAATKAGTKVDDIIDQPLGNLMEVGLPFGKKYGIGTAQSPAAMKIAGGLDKVSQTLRYGKIPGTGFAPGTRPIPSRRKRAGTYSVSRPRRGPMPGSGSLPWLRSTTPWPRAARGSPTPMLSARPWSCPSSARSSASRSRT
jgi:hypothetical protein